ncbi:DNA-directed RNA polymerase subunit 10-like protein [Diplonema papillatum]|nr:DNA-directed RNA polymerase subunit 10-like protein [Diplonema papillatum]
MIIPVRCFTCGKIIGNMWEEWCEFLLQDMTEGEALTKLGLVRLCCRAQLLTHVPLIDKFNMYKKASVQDTKEQAAKHMQQQQRIALQPMQKAS